MNQEDKNNYGKNKPEIFLKTIKNVNWVGLGSFLIRTSRHFFGKEYSFSFSFKILLLPFWLPFSENLAKNQRIHWFRVALTKNLGVKWKEVVSGKFLWSCHKFFVHLKEFVDRNLFENQVQIGINYINGKNYSSVKNFFLTSLSDWFLHIFRKNFYDFFTYLLELWSMRTLLPLSYL